jgi:hypothetical protein
MSWLDRLGGVLASGQSIYVDCALCNAGGLDGGVGLPESEA